MDDIRDQSAHVLWIGDAPNVGKTTLTRLLAGNDLKIYDSDWHHVREHRGRPGGVPAGWDELSMEQRWVHPSPRELADREIANWTARFPLVMEDIRALPHTRPIVAEDLRSSRGASLRSFAPPDRPSFSSQLLSSASAFLGGALATHPRASAPTA